MELIEQPAREQSGDARITAVPAFLKVAFALIVAGCGAYFLMSLHGADHAGRGALAQAMDAATRTSAVLMYGVTALIVIYGVIAVAGAVRERD